MPSFSNSWNKILIIVKFLKCNEMFPMLNSIQTMASMKDFDYSRKKLSYFFNGSPGVDPGGAPGACPLKLEKNMIFCRKIVIFHTKYPNKFRATLRSAQFF